MRRAISLVPTMGSVTARQVLGATTGPVRTKRKSVIAAAVMGSVPMDSVLMVTVVTQGVQGPVNLVLVPTRASQTVPAALSSTTQIRTMSAMMQALPVADRMVSAMVLGPATPMTKARSVRLIAATATT